MYVRVFGKAGVVRDRLPLQLVCGAYCAQNWKTPFIAGYVDFPEKVRVFAHMVDIDPECLSFDMKLRVCKAVVGQDADGTQIESYSFVPVEGRN